MNKNGTKRQINLASEISMVRNHGKPSTDWNTFDDINGPVYNETLSPLYFETSDNDTKPLYDNDGNEYVYKNGALYKNGKVIRNTENKSFKKEVLDIDSNAVIIADNKVCYTKFDNGVLTIYKDKQVLTTQTFGSSDIIAERLWVNGSDIRYFCLHNDNTYSVYYSGNWSIAKSITWYLKNNAVNKPDISTPLISVNGNYVFITNKSGPLIDYADLHWFMLSLDSNNTINQITNFSMSYSEKQVTTTETISLSTCKIKSTTTNQQFTCTKTGDKYYDESGNEITFSKGYAPVFVSDNTYRYIVYTTSYDYTIAVSDASFINNIKISFNLSDVNYPDDIANKVFSKTLTKNNKTYSTNLTYTSNLGYISGNSFVNVDAVLTWVSTSYLTIPNSWFSIETFFLNRTSSASKSLSYTKTEIQQVNDGAFVQSVMLDDGKFYSLGYKANETENNSLSLNLCNEIQSKDSASSIRLKGIGEYTSSRTDTDTFFNHWKATTVQLGQNYFRSFMFFKKSSSAELHQLSLINHWVRYYPGYISYGDKKYAEFDNPMADNNRGDRVGSSGFRVLFNDGYISGISYAPYYKVQGTLVTPWLSIDTEVYYQTTSTFALYKNKTLNKWIYIKVVNNANEMKLIEDRYLVLNTTDYYNCYDIKLGSFEHYASDWNNRYDIGGGGYNAIKNKTVGTGENVIYSSSESGLTSALWPAVALNDVGSTVERCLANGVDLFISEGTSLPKYKTTFYNGGERKVINPALEVSGNRVSYPSISSSYIRVNPSFFTDFVQTGNNKDYMVDDGWGYQIFYDNDITPILQASTSTYVDNMEAVFVVQSMPYGVMNNKLYSLNYLNGEYKGADAIMNIKGMQYVGNIPTKAYFYSPMNRSIYAFTGDANLSLIKEASAIGKIYKTWYNSSTQTVYMSTDNGLYMLSATNTYRQEFFAVEDIYFNNDGTSYIINKENGKYITYHLSLEYKEGFKTNKVRLDTGLYGVEGGENIVIDRWNITLWNDRKANGTIKVQSFTLTDKGTLEKEVITREIKATDWDNDWNNVQVSWVPKYNRGIGVGAFIETDFAVSSIVASISKDSNTMPSKVNI